MKRNLFPLTIIAALFFLAVLLPTQVAAIALNATGAPLIPSLDSSTSMATHVVQRGDTLYSIARRYDTTVDALLMTNGLDSNTIWIGQVLQISSFSPSSAYSAPSAGYIEHTVVREDTLYSLSRRYGSTVEAIMQVNHLSGTNINAGQRLLIASTSVPMAQNNNAYTVAQRDTLYSIARRYGTTVDAIMALNKLSSSHIFVGQRLLITPVKSPSAQITVVPTAIPMSTAVPSPVAPPTPMRTPLPMQTSMATPRPSASPTATRQFTTYQCSSDTYNCEEGRPQEESQRIYEYCFDLTGRDIHDLDRDDDGVACEADLRTSAPTGPFILNECGSNVYNCGNFVPQEDAQRTFEHCLNLNGGDIHDLDRDDDGVACEENLPRGFTLVR
jgi:LysM repeat protein